MQCKSRTALFYNVKQLLQRKTLYMQVYISLLHLNPLGKNIIVFVDDVSKLMDIFISFKPDILFLTAIGQSVYFIDNSVYERSYAVNYCQLGSLFKVPLSELCDIHSDKFRPFLNFLNLLQQFCFQSLVILLPFTQRVKHGFYREISLIAFTLMRKKEK